MFLVNTKSNYGTSTTSQKSHVPIVLHSLLNPCTPWCPYRKDLDSPEPTQAEEVGNTQADTLSQPQGKQKIVHSHYDLLKGMLLGIGATLCLVQWLTTPAKTAKATHVGSTQHPYATSPASTASTPGEQETNRPSVRVGEESPQHSLEPYSDSGYYPYLHGGERSISMGSCSIASEDTLYTLEIVQQEAITLLPTSSDDEEATPSRQVFFLELQDTSHSTAPHRSKRKTQSAPATPRSRGTAKPPLIFVLSSAKQEQATAPPSRLTLTHPANSFQSARLAIHKPLDHRQDTTRYPSC